MKESLTFEHSRFGWFEGHGGMGDSSLSRLGLPPRGKAPVTFKVSFPEGEKTFILQYSVTADSDDYTSKYLAVYWGGTQVLHVHYC